MDYLKDEKIVSEIQDLVNCFENATNSASDYMEFMREMFLSCSCQN